MGILREGILCANAPNEANVQKSGNGILSVFLFGLQGDLPDPAFSLPGKQMAGDRIFPRILFGRIRSHFVTLLDTHQLRGQNGHFQTAMAAWGIAKGPTDLLLGGYEKGLYIRCPHPAICDMFRIPGRSMRGRGVEESARRALLKGNTARILQHEEGLSFKSEAAKTVWLSAGVTLQIVSGITGDDSQVFRISTGITGRLIGRPDYEPIISDCELAGAIIAILLWGLRGNLPRILALGVDNLNALHWSEAADTKEGLSWELLRLALRWCVGRSNNIGADGLTRWAIDEDESRYQHHGMTGRGIPETWPTWANEWVFPQIEPPLSSVALMGKFPPLLPISRPKSIRMAFRIIPHNGNVWRMRAQSELRRSIRRTGFSTHARNR